MKISIITVCLNSEQTIEKTILSVINQKNQDFEYIIIDGGSTDNTKKIIDKYKNNIDLFISEKDSGIYDALNKAIDLSTGEIISILHSNDIYSNNNVLEDVLFHFNKNKKIDIVLGSVLLKKMNSEKTSRFYSVKNFKPWMLRVGISPPHPGSFIKRSIYLDKGNYDTSYKIASDFDLFVRYLLKDKLKYEITNQCYVKMNSGGLSNSEVSSHITSTKEILKSLKKNEIYSNIFLVLLRFPIKFIQYIKK